MNANSKLVDPIKGKSTLVRPKFSEGLLLNDDDLTLGVDYTRELSRLMFRTLFGCGVMCGLVVRPEYKCDKLYIQIGDGVALDCHGDPIQVPSPQTIIIDPKCGTEIGKVIWIVLCRHDNCCAPRNAVCSCDDVDTPSVCTRIREGFEIRVLPKRPGCACGCVPPKKSSSSGYLDTSQSQESQNSMEELVGIYVADGATETSDSEKPYDCKCADPDSDCYKDHYDGLCSCECGESCDCDCVILARLYLAKNGDKEPQWHADHGVRRFIRPVLMRDPQVAIEQKGSKEPKQQGSDATIADLEAIKEKVEEIEEEVEEIEEKVDEIESKTAKRRKPRRSSSNE